MTTKDRYGTGITGAVAMALDLMAGDAATFKRGYSAENAARAVANVFSVDKADVLAGIKAETEAATTAVAAVTAEMEGRYAMELAKRLRAAEVAGDTDAIVACENEIAALIELDLDETEQGLSTKAADAITAFCREQGVT